MLSACKTLSTLGWAQLIGDFLLLLPPPQPNWAQLGLAAHWGGATKWLFKSLWANSLDKQTTLEGWPDGTSQLTIMGLHPLPGAVLTLILVICRGETKFARSSHLIASHWNILHTRIKEFRRILRVLCTHVFYCTARWSTNGGKLCFQRDHLLLLLLLLLLLHY